MEPSWFLHVINRDPIYIIYLCSLQDWNETLFFLPLFLVISYYYITFPHCQNPVEPMFSKMVLRFLSMPAAPKNHRTTRRKGRVCMTAWLCIGEKCAPWTCRRKGPKQSTNQNRTGSTSPSWKGWRLCCLSAARFPDPLGRRLRCRRQSWWLLACPPFPAAVWAWQTIRLWALGPPTIQRCCWCFGP